MGLHPYQDIIVPFLGSSYAQLGGTWDTPTTRIIGQHFQDYCDLRPLIVRCDRKSWKTIKAGCVCLNTSYDSGSANVSTSVMHIKRLHYSIEFISLSY